MRHKLDRFFLFGMSVVTLIGSSAMLPFTAYGQNSAAGGSNSPEPSLNTEGGAIATEDIAVYIGIIIFFAIFFGIYFFLRSQPAEYSSKPRNKR